MHSYGYVTKYAQGWKLIDKNNSLLINNSESCSSERTKTKKDVTTIYNHLFTKKHVMNVGTKVRYFDPNIDMAKSLMGKN